MLWLTPSLNNADEEVDSLFVSFTLSYLYAKANLKTYAISWLSYSWDPQSKNKIINR